MKRSNLKALLRLISGPTALVATIYMIASIVAAAIGMIGYGRGAIQTIIGTAVMILCLLIMEAE